MNKRKLQLLFNQQKSSLYLDFSTVVDGALPKFTGATWAVSSGVVINTPVLGNELTSNGNMETGDPPTGWPNFAGSIPSSFAEERTGGAGTKSLKVARDASDFPYAAQNLTVAVGDWILLNGWFKNVDVVSQYMQLRNIGYGAISSINLNSASWVNQKIVGRATETTIRVFLGLNATGKADGTYGLFDDISAKKITTADMFAKLSTKFSSALVVRAAWNITDAVFQAGVVGWWDGTNALQNCLVAYHNKTKVYLDKYVGTTLTNLINSTVAHVPGANVEIRRVTGTNTFQLYYGGVQIGTDQTVSDAAIINNGYFGLFSVGSSNQCDSFYVGRSPL